MTINLKTVMAGPGGTRNPGRHTLSAEEEAALVKAGAAEYSKDSGPPRPERAVQAPTERSTAPAQRTGRKGKPHKPSGSVPPPPPKSLGGPKPSNS